MIYYRVCPLWSWRSSSPERGPSWLAHWTEHSWKSCLWDVTRSVPLRTSHMSEAILAGMLTCGLCGLPLWEEGSERWRGTYLSLLESRLPSQVAMCGKSLLWVSVSLFCYRAAWLLKYIGKVLSITAKERQSLTGTTKHIKAVEHKASLYFPKLIHVKGGVLFLDITEWNRKLPWWVT